MATKNIAIEKGVAYVDSFPYPATPMVSEALILIQFYQNGNPLPVQLASEKFGGDEGEIEIDSGVGFNARMEVAETLLLPDSNVSYKLFRIDPSTLEPLELFAGTVTVTGQVSEQAPLPQPFSNDGNQKVVSTNYTLKYQDHIILLDPNGADIELTFPDPAPVRTKEYILKLRTAGSVRLLDKDDNQMALISDVNDFIKFVATDKPVFETII